MEVDVEAIGRVVSGVATFSLMLIMLSMGLALEAADFLRVLRRPRAAVLGLFGQLLLLPVVAFGLAHLLDLDPILAIGLMVLAACPGGATSNAISVMARGDAALSVSLTAVSSFVAFLTAPFVIGLALEQFQVDGRSLSIPFVESSLQIFGSTVLPVVLGMFLRDRAIWLRTRRRQIFNVGLTLVLTCSGILLLGRFTLLDSGQAALAAVALNVVMMALAWAMARALLDDEAATRSITIEVGLQNVSLALVIIVSFLDVLEALAPTLFYLPCAYVTGFGFAWLVRRRSADEPEGTRTAT
ncbi:MAG: bile acid:sodium symporter [Myxococcota bacterium]